ncbi:MAG TPA: hypothetical protein VIG06_27710, partial [Kofleriaceae bacterium]
MRKKSRLRSSFELLNGLTQRERHTPMRSFRRALGLLAASAPLALAVACADPELKSDLVTEGPPEVTEVNVLSESVILADATFLRLGEAATYCRP